MKLKTHFALLSAKLVKSIVQFLGKNGSQIPGRVATNIDKDILKNLEKPKYNIAVTGTNGKTTTTNMIADIIKDLGKSHRSNRLGSNTYYGIASTVIESNNLLGKSKVEYGIFEVDEIWTSAVLNPLNNTTLSITNLSQDSFERNANVYYILMRIEESISKTTKLILNANDSILAFIKPENDRVYFSVRNIFNEEERLESNIEDLRYCPKCGGNIEWDFKRYNHIGEYKCETCDFKIPHSEYEVTEYIENDNRIKILDHGKELTLPLINKTIENVYNQICVYATLRENGFTYQEINKSMEKIDVVKTRFKSKEIKNKKIISLVSKGYNPIANSRIFDTISKVKGDKTVIYLFDNIESNGSIDVRTPGWINAIDFSYVENGIDKVIFKSRHANEFYLSMLLQGVDRIKIESVDKLEDILKFIDKEKQETIFILHDIEPLNNDQADMTMKIIVDYLNGEVS